MLLETKDALVIGGGIAGCAAAKQLQTDGINYLLLEKNPELGGLTRSTTVGEAIFDYTGHFLHLARHDTPSLIPYANLKDTDWQRIHRKSLVYLNGQFIPAPFQYNLYYLPEGIRRQCIQDFRGRPNIENPKTFREYLLAGFGTSICEYFLFPYNEKITKTDLDSLSVNSVKRFFPKPDPEVIERGYAVEGANLSTGYNSTFWYPKNFGIGRLAQGLASGLHQVRTNCSVEAIDINKRIVRTRWGAFGFSKLLSSIPLKDLCERTNDETLRKLAGHLSHNMVLCINLLVRGSLTRLLDHAHWVYIPDRAIPFHRLGIYSNLRERIVPPGKTSLYVEVSARAVHRTPPDFSDIVDRVFSALEELGWTSRKQVEVLSINWIPCAYVHFNHARQTVVSEIFRLLKERGIYPIGRYGCWDYISMEDTILSSIQAARLIQS